MRKVIRGLLFTFIAFALVSCDKKVEREVPETIPYEPSADAVLSKVENIKVKNKILTFDAVENAVSYEVEIYSREKLIVSTIIGKPSLDLSSYHLIGSYDVKIKAVKGINSGEVVSAKINVLEEVEDVILEAEAGLLDYTLYKGNELAHGNVYIGNIDNCGQGIYYNYFCYVAGSYNLEVHYLTEAIDSKHDVLINGEYATTIIYDENTGWGTASNLNTAVKVVSVEFEQGWNTICLIKNGTSDDNYGGWAELDYLVIKGMNYEYNPFEFESTIPSYRLEAELGCAIKRTATAEGYRWINNNSNNVPMPSANASTGFLRGDFAEVGEGIEWQFTCSKAGMYQVTISYAASSEDNGAKIYFYNSDITFRDNTVSALELLEKYNQTIISLGTGDGWDNPKFNEQTFILELKEGSNFIYALREETAESGYFQIDYIELTYMEEK